MPLYDFVCDTCGQKREVLKRLDECPPSCCGAVMRRIYTGRQLIKWGPPLFTSRIDDIHKAQEQRGERLRFVHPSEVL